MSAPTPSIRTPSILIINPNTTQAMTDALKPVVESLSYQNTHYTYFTAPSGAASINNEEDATTSTKASLPALQPLLATHDSFLVCCYSAHPLVPALRSELAAQNLPRKPVAGIFEASVAACLQLLSFSLPKLGRFAIVTTGPQYEILLNGAVAALLGGSESQDGVLLSSSLPESGRFAGTFTTGLNADELHRAEPELLRERMKEAAKKGLRHGARALCLGCAGMVGLEGTVREACIEELGGVEGSMVWIVDGVASGVAFLQGVLRGT